MTLVEKVKAKVKELQEKGLPIIVLRDVVTGKPSITYTLFVASAVMCLLAQVEYSRASIDLNFDEALQFFDSCAMAYIGRHVIKMFNGNGNGDSAAPSNGTNQSGDAANK
jgi:hypothetical protein